VAPQLKKSTFKANWKAFMAIANLPFGRMNRESALIHSGPIQKIMKGLWGDTRLEDLKIKTIIQVTDFQTGEGIGLESGLLADCVYASSAIYPLLPPIQIGQRWLFDGAFTAPIPVLQAIKRKPDIIIVVDFLEKLHQDPNGFLDTMIHIGNLNIKTISATQMALSIDLHHAEIIYMKVEFEKYISFWEIEKFPFILDAGKKALDKIKDEFLLAYKHLSKIS
jgi:NTE family protein